MNAIFFALIFQVGRYGNLKKNHTKYHGISVNWSK